MNKKVKKSENSTCKVEPQNLVNAVNGKRNLINNEGLIKLKRSGVARLPIIL